MPSKTLSIPSVDGLAITAFYYDGFKGRKTTEKNKFTIILCHQAGWSRGEYLEIAPSLRAEGFSCLALDQRSGGGVNDVANETAKLAEKLKKPTTYLDAEQDIVAAVRWVKANKKGQKIILWGSSYSASLVLKVAQDEGVDKVLSFSPGEYFKDKMTLKEKINKLDIPVFITCSKKEIERTQSIFDVIPSKSKIFFKPSTTGNHGSRALWSKFDDSDAYWEAVRSFLKE